MGNSMDLNTGPEVSASGTDPLHAGHIAGRTHTRSLSASKNVSDIQPPDTDQQLASTETSKMEVPTTPQAGRPSKPGIADSTTVSAKTSLWAGELGTQDGSRMVAPGMVRYTIDVYQP